MNSLHTAMRIAYEAHESQKDKAGVPYVLHVIRVGLAGSTLEEQIVGLLHDTLEDTAVTEALLREMFTPDIVQAIVTMTRKPGEFYHTAYIERIAKNPLARRVKINDLRDNLGRLGPEIRLGVSSSIREADRKRLFRRYNKALLQLGA